MNPRVTVGLLAVLIALGAYVYFGPTPAPAGGPGAPGGPGATPTPQLDMWKVDDQQVAAIEVTKPDASAGVQRNGDDWILTPSGEPADRLRVNSLVFRLAALRATRRLDSVTNLDEYGLTVPAMVATLRMADSSVHTLKIGGKAPAESGTYSLKDDDPTVYLLSNALAQDIEKLITDPPRPLPPTASPSPGPGG